MNRRNRRRRRNRKGRRRLWPAVCFVGLLAAGAAAGAVLFLYPGEKKTMPDELLTAYMAHIEEKEYEEMYRMLDPMLSGGVDEEAFIRRNSAIY